jgi:hypothetical protein
VLDDGEDAAAGRTGARLLRSRSVGQDIIVVLGIADDAAAGS